MSLPDFGRNAVQTDDWHRHVGLNDSVTAVCTNKVRVPMPSVDFNRFWGRYSWPQGGEEWSADWGDAETQWHTTILPRIRRFLPSRRILEIAPGFGRWSTFLIDCADEYIGIDLNKECVLHCQERFAETSRAKFVENDGKSLAAVADASIDFAFSFDSLVHAEIDVIDAYLWGLSRKLTQNGTAFIHHSNLGQYSGIAIELSVRLSQRTRNRSHALRMLERMQLCWDQWRAPSVTAQKFADVATSHGLACIGQEIINWGRYNWRTIDCFSVLTRSGSRGERSNIAVRNPYFMKEAFSAHVVSDIYTSLGRDDPTKKTPHDSHALSNRNKGTTSADQITMTIPDLPDLLR
jgi:hypothetical protein